ncbi:MAG TPA: DmsC/YnfH family molybdoenzyme membrane anchor subunit [Planctomycetaceae bacterium]|nr:DmsC/YnfH family molybdoenzyme membrane anchor subunit [Planctomycetaceae bacterium]
MTAVVIPPLRSELRPITAPPRTVIDDFLVEQQRMTAVETFSRWHHDEAPAQSKYYSALLPASPPGPGEQYAFEVDLDRCSGCKACVTACHSLNGLDDDEAFRDVGLLIGGTAALPVIQHVTTACHHCLEPACASACPVDAYEKSPVTGIVKHLDDQCIGCQYCTLACPYDVPKYHAGKGIVRKCDLCSSRLAVGEAPACVQACPHEAIRIRVVNVADVIADSESRQFLPGAPDPQFTLPTTTYVTNRVFPRNVIPADYHTPRMEHAHWSLIVMLVLTQLSVGAFAVEFWLTSQWRTWWGGSTTQIISLGEVPALTALLLGLLALGAATLHLGRPHLAYRAVIGLTHSWLSREIVMFGVFAKCAALYATAGWWGPWVAANGITAVLPWLGIAVVATGLVGVFCSVMIYDYTQRPFWNGLDTAVKFFGTTVTLGATTVLLALVVSQWIDGDTTSSLLVEQGPQLCRVLAVATLIKLGWELRILTALFDRTLSPLRRSAQLLTGALRPVLGWRIGLGVVGGILLPWGLLSMSAATWSPVESSVLVTCGLSSLAVVLGEFAERYLFFAAVVANRMPGGLST